MGVVREARIAVDAAIAARPAPDIAARTRTGADGRTRYHGRSRRGAPSKLQTDEWDLRAIEVEISRARADLIAYWSPENQALPPIQRDAARRSQLGHLELVQRFVDDLVERTRKGLR